MTEPPTAASYGVGARIALHPMTDRYVEVILGALAEVAQTPAAAAVRTETTDVSTFVGGDESAVLAWCADLVRACTERCEGAHLGVVLMLSRGCPGELSCELPDGLPWVAQQAMQLPPTGVQASAEWSLYPLLDGHPSPAGDHMAPIMAAIELARESGLYAGSVHYATRLRGDVAEILSLVATAWLRTGAVVGHVTTHLSLSINSPTPEAS